MNLKQEAAKAAVGLIHNNMSVGLGAGSTMAYLVTYLQQTKPNITLYTSSADTRELLEQNNFTVQDVSGIHSLDIYFDGCDQFDEHLNALKSGGGIHTAEKLLASMATQFILVGDDSKYAKQLTTKYPLVLEILPQAVIFAKHKLQEYFGDIRIETRSKSDGHPVITQNGNHLCDVYFQILPPLHNLNTICKSITGVVETSLFYNLASKAIIAGENGIRILENNSRLKEFF